MGGTDCARATNGNAAVKTAIPSMKARRRIAAPQGSGLHQGFAIDEMGFRDKLHSSNSELPMSALGH